MTVQPVAEHRPRAMTYASEIPCDYAVGDRVWVCTSVLARGRAKGTVAEITPHEYEHMEGACKVTLRIYTVEVALDRPVHIPRSSYLADKPNYRRLIDWPGASRITGVAPHELEPAA